MKLGTTHCISMRAAGNRTRAADFHHHPSTYRPPRPSPHKPGAPFGPGPALSLSVRAEGPRYLVSARCSEALAVSPGGLRPAVPQSPAGPRPSPSTSISKGLH